AAWRRIDEAGMGPGGDEITRHEPAAAPGEMVRKPREKAAGMAGSVAADGIRHRLTVDVEACRLVQKIDGAPLRQWRAVAKGTMAPIVSQQGQLVGPGEIGEAGVDDFDRGMECGRGLPHLALVIGAGTGR